MNVRHCKGNCLLIADTDKSHSACVFSAVLTASKRPIMTMVRFFNLSSSSRPVLLLALDSVLDCISTVFVVGLRSDELFMDLFGLARVKGAWMAAQGRRRDCGGGSVDGV